MTTLHWLNGINGTWNAAADWTAGTLPGAFDAAVIDAAGTYAVTIAVPAVAGSLLLNAAGATVIDSASLALAGALTAAAGTFDLAAGGVVSGGTLSATGGSFGWNGGTLSGATYQGAMDFTAAGASLTIANGFTATGAGGVGAGTINADGAAASLTFAATQTLDNMTINAGNLAGAGGTALNFGDLTLGAQATLNQVGGGAVSSSWASDTGTSLTNNGTIQASVANAGANIVVASLVNNGLISAVPGAAFSLQASSLTNNGTVSGVVAISAGTLTNNGVMSDGAGVSPTTFVNTGVFNDTGGLATTPGGWLNTGVFNLGNPTGSQSYLALVGGTGAPVAGVSLGTLNLVGVGTQLRLLGSQSWQSGTINVGGTAQQITESALTPVVGATNQLILGTQTTINHIAGVSTFNTGQLTLNGSLNASAAGGMFTLASGSLVDNGAINVSGGDHLMMSDPVTGTGQITIAGSGVAEFGYPCSVASTDTLVFTDTSNSTLRLDLGSVSGFKSAIQGFTDGNTIDLGGITATGATWSNGVLTIAGSGWGTPGPITLAMPGNYAGATFHVAPDGILAAIPGLGFGTSPGNNITVTGASTPPPPPPGTLAGSGATLAAPEGSAVTAALANFTDSNAADAASGFSATIAWGDGTTSAGVVSGSAGSFTVAPAAGHAFADEGSYATGITVLRAADGASLNLVGSITAGEADVLTAGSANISVTAGSAFSGTVATFTDSYAGASAADFAATIAWGDGTTSAGTVSLNNGTISVAGGHTYAAAGTDPVSVTLNDITGTATATATGTASVAAPAGGGATGLDILSISTDGIGPFGVWTPPNVGSQTASIAQVGTLIAATSAATAADAATGAQVASNQIVSAAWLSAYTGTAIFQDQWSSTGVTTGAYNAEQSFGMQAGANYAHATFSFTMASAGSFGVSWVATEASTNGGAFGLLNMTVSIDGGTAMQVNPVNASVATPTGSFTGALTAGAHTIEIMDWSNYSGAMGTMTGQLNETLNLTLSPGGGVTPPPNTYGGSGATLAATEGSAVTAALASFTDSNATDAAGNFTATIAWGDGTTSVGTVSGGNGSFTVSDGSGHAYADEGSYATTITVTSAVDGVQTVLSGSVTAGEADVLAAGAPLALAATAGQAVTGTVASFTDSYAGATAADLAATIAWGDGTTSAGTVTAVAGGFAVSGSHAWSAAGSDAVSVTLTDTNGTATATAAATATVAAAGGGTYTLTTGQDTLIGGAGDDVFIARTNTLSNGDVIDGGGGSNKLVLQGAGKFNLAAVDQLLNIQTLCAREQTIGTQTVTLRENTALTVNVAAPAAGGTGSITILGAQNTDTINLGNGNDTVVLGVGETVNGGSGNDTYKVTADTIGDTIHGGSGHNTLVVTGGGSVAMGPSITGMNAVTLAARTHFTADATPGLAITGSAVGHDVITLGAASQSVVGGGPGEKIRASAANASAQISGLGAGAALEITSGGTVALDPNASLATVKLDAASHLMLSTMQFLAATGSGGADTIVAGAASQTLTGGGGADTLVGYAGGGDTFKDTAGGLNKDLISGFLASDAIDITNLAFAGAVLKVTPSGANTLVSLTSGAVHTGFTMEGSWSAGGFAMASDGAGGTLLSHA